MKNLKSTDTNTFADKNHQDRTTNFATTIRKKIVWIGKNTGYQNDSDSAKP